jgi:hypothetical protein
MSNELVNKLYTGEVGSLFTFNGQKYILGTNNNNTLTFYGLNGVSESVPLPEKTGMNIKEGQNETQKSPQKALEEIVHSGVFGSYQPGIPAKLATGFSLMSKDPKAYYDIKNNNGTPKEYTKLFPSGEVKPEDCVYRVGTNGPNINNIVDGKISGNKLNAFIKEYNDKKFTLTNPMVEMNKIGVVTGQVSLVNIPMQGEIKIGDKAPLQQAVGWKTTAADYGKDIGPNTGENPAEVSAPAKKNWYSGISFSGKKPEGEVAAAPKQGLFSSSLFKTPNMGTNQEKTSNTEPSEKKPGVLSGFSMTNNPLTDSYNQQNEILKGSQEWRKKMDGTPVQAEATAVPIADAQVARPSTFSFFGKKNIPVATAVGGKKSRSKRRKRSRSSTLKKK